MLSGRPLGLEPHQGTLDSSGAPRLLLVPSADANLGTAAEYQNKVDGRHSIVLLSLDSLREPPEKAIRVLATYAGQRFINGTPDPAVETESPGIPPDLS